MKVLKMLEKSSHTPEQVLRDEKVRENIQFPAPRNLPDLEESLQYTQQAFERIMSYQPVPDIILVMGKTTNWGEPLFNAWYQKMYPEGTPPKPQILALNSGFANSGFGIDEAGNIDTSVSSVTPNGLMYKNFQDGSNPSTEQRVTLFEEKYPTFYSKLFKDDDPNTKTLKNIVIFDNATISNTKATDLESFFSALRKQTDKTTSGYFKQVYVFGRNQDEVMTPLPESAEVIHETGRVVPTRIEDHLRPIYHHDDLTDFGKNRALSSNRAEIEKYFSVLLEYPFSERLSKLYQIASEMNKVFHTLQPDVSARAEAFVAAALYDREDVDQLPGMFYIPPEHFSESDEFMDASGMTEPDIELVFRWIDNYETFKTLVQPNQLIYVARSEDYIVLRLLAHHHQDNLNLQQLDTVDTFPDQAVNDALYVFHNKAELPDAIANRACIVVDGEERQFLTYQQFYSSPLWQERYRTFKVPSEGFFGNNTAQAKLEQSIKSLSRGFDTGFDDEDDFISQFVEVDLSEGSELNSLILAEEIQGVDVHQFLKRLQQLQRIIKQEYTGSEESTASDYEDLLYDISTDLQRLHQATHKLDIELHLNRLVLPASVESALFGELYNQQLDEEELEIKDDWQRWLADKLDEKYQDYLASPDVQQFANISTFVSRTGLDFGMLRYTTLSYYNDQVERLKTYILTGIDSQAVTSSDDSVTSLGGFLADTTRFMPRWIVTEDDKDPIDDRSQLENAHTFLRKAQAVKYLIENKKKK